jgi:hypothetical protein
MATDIVQSLFGVTPQAYQQAQQDRMDAQALQYARLDPFQQANYAIGRGASGLAGAIGGALGGQDPELQRITMRQQIAGQLDPNDLSTFDRGIEMMRQGGDGQGAMMLTMEKDKARQLAQERQLNTLKTEDYLTQRGQGIQAKGLEQLANELVGTMKNPDGTLNQDVVNKLRSFPQGMAAITAQAKILPDLRKLGATAAPEVDPFTPFITDATIPKNVQTYAKQLSKSFADGVLDPEKVDVRVKELSEMTQRAQQFQQNQDQITSNQKVLADLRSQGLDNSRQSLLLQQQQAQLAQDNATYKREMQQAEALRKEEARKNKPLPSYLAKEEEADYSAASAATNIATDAYGYINRIKTGDIKFGVKDLASIRARQLVGSGAPDVVAREEYDRFVENLVNESLRLNKGTQTEGDAVREAKALKSSESKEAAAAAMKRLIEINTRRVENASSAVEKRRANAGFPSAPQPIVIPQFDVQIITPAEYNSFLKNPKFPSGTVFVDPDGVRRRKP